MRVTFLTVGTAFAIGLIGSTSSFAQTAVHKSFNQCVQLAMQRGYSTSDLDGGPSHQAARNFVIACMQGKQQ